MATGNVESLPSNTAQQAVPRAGMLAIVRKRWGVISEAREFDGQNGRCHLVRVDYKDDHRPPFEEVVWELEPATQALEPNELPRAKDSPMVPEDFEALVRAGRWSAITPYLHRDARGSRGRLPASSPFHGAVELDNYQLVPLLKALRMPRVNLLLADDVGLGKTIEAGLILSESLIRRRVNRVLVLTPASLRIQWRDEMWTKFSLPFDVIDSGSTMRMKRSIGIDANPWRCCARIIASYHHLRQPDVLEHFLSASRVPEGSPSKSSASACSAARWRSWTRGGGAGWALRRWSPPTTTSLWPPGAPPKRTPTTTARPNSAARPPLSSSARG